MGCIKRHVASMTRQIILSAWLFSGETPAQQRHGPARASPEEGHEDDQRA